LTAAMRNSTAICLLLVCLGFGTAAGVARADVVVIVSAQSRLKDLRTDQLAAIFLGKIAALPDGTPVVPLDLTEGAAPRNAFYEKYIGKTPSQLRAYWSKLIFSGKGHPPRASSTEEDMKKIIAEHPDRIGYIDRAALDGSVRPLTLTEGP
jgi:ABC-type phosphate transport system substrate-binding protein